METFFDFKVSRINDFSQTIKEQVAVADGSGT